MAALHAIIFHVFFSVNFFIATTMVIATVATTTKPRRLVTRLHHRDSIFYNPNETNYDRAKRLIDISINRFIYLSQKSSKTYNVQAVQPSLTLGTQAALFYVNFSIGQPPVPQLNIMDTGSYLIWVNCNSDCQFCGRPVFDPSKSSSFVKSSCNNTFCDGCSSNNECKFELEFVNGPNSGGIIGTDQFSFESSDEGTITINNVVFGCALTNIDGKVFDKTTGIFGLGLTEAEEFSIVKHLGSTKFSYCVGSTIDHAYKYNRLALGEGSVMEGSSTPFEISGASYHLNLEGISVGQKRLAIDPNVFKRKENVTSGVSIDSGSIMNWLTPIAYQTFTKEIENVAQGLLTRKRYIGQREWQLCFGGDVTRDLHGFPAMTFHFSQGADMVVDALGMFIQMQDSLFCLVFGPSDFHGQEYKDLSIIGMMAQQKYNVGYDFSQNRLYLQRIDCALLDN